MRAQATTWPSACTGRSTHAPPRGASMRGKPKITSPFKANTWMRSGKASGLALNGPAAPVGPGGRPGRGLSSSNSSVQPDGKYHYHGIPEGLVTKLSSSSKGMTLIGWAADGFPIYARYGYTTAADASSAVKVMASSYRIKTTPDAHRPSTTTYAMGTFTQDYEYVAGLGDLDECNGRTGVTPEFPKGIYHYMATDTYPYLQRCIKGQL
ncbi:MAG: hypothetical protein C4K60_00555 [Ideonella sp. MAG2]|nr:MAG: hypothetical protein C4K60_00555 [Ideonella sp. MAG2]